MYKNSRINLQFHFSLLIFPTSFISQVLLSHINSAPFFPAPAPLCALCSEMVGNILRQSRVMNCRDTQAGNGVRRGEGGRQANTLWPLCCCCCVVVVFGKKASRRLSQKTTTTMDSNKNWQLGIHWPKTMQLISLSPRRSCRRE